MPPRLREHDGGRVRGRAPVLAGGRARSLGRGKGRVEGASSASSVSGGHDKAPQMFHFTPEALREFVRAIRDEIQPPPPPPVVVEPVVHRAPAEPRAQSAMREPGLRGKVVSFELNTFEEVMKKALVIDGEAQEAKMDRDSRTLGKGSHSGQQPKRQRQEHSQRQQQSSYSQPQQSQQQRSSSQYQSRGSHQSDTGAKSAVQTTTVGASRGQPRLYAVTDIAPEPSVIRGTFPIFNSWVTVLIDTGASCSFIASAFAFALGLEVDLLDSTLLVDTPVGGVVPLNRRRVTITISSGDSFYFVGDRLDFSTSSLHHLRGRQYTTGYLASLWAEEGEAALAELPPIVWKANVVADALSRKPRSTAAFLVIHEWKMLEQLGEFDLEVNESAVHATLFTLVAQPTLLSRVLEAQQSDEEAVSFRARVTSDEAMDGWTFSPDSGLRYRSRPFVPLALRDDTKELQGAPTKNAVSGDFLATSDLRPKHESCSPLRALRFRPIGIPIGLRLDLRFSKNSLISKR
ncbi:hypothetical protein Acr_00g0020100 [Actinidia rufa]|uniref:Uncharacterized protein n=1 Tax=Actinidia rufa TaxID=165716 RepID=A0A7J0DBW3_9ERIC|nr:hypothetical protein Acr_00g0020100 [Actinidia rufa]